MTVLLALFIAMFLDPIRAVLCAAAYWWVVKPIAVRHGMTAALGAAAIMTAIVSALSLAILASTRMTELGGVTIICGIIATAAWIGLFLSVGQAMRRKKASV